MMQAASPWRLFRRMFGGQDDDQRRGESPSASTFPPPSQPSSHYSHGAEGLPLLAMSSFDQRKRPPPLPSSLPAPRLPPKRPRWREWETETRAPAPTESSISSSLMRLEQDPNAMTVLSEERAHNLQRLEGCHQRCQALVGSLKRTLVEQEQMQRRDFMGASPLDMVRPQGCQQ